MRLTGTSWTKSRGVSNGKPVDTRDEEAADRLSTAECQQTQQNSAGAHGNPLSLSQISSCLSRCSSQVANKFLRGIDPQYWSVHLPAFRATGAPSPGFRAPRDCQFEGTPAVAAERAVLDLEMDGEDALIGTMLRELSLSEIMRVHHQRDGRLDKENTDEADLRVNVLVGGTLPQMGV
jgi:hypothetical protein